MQSHEGRVGMKVCVTGAGGYTGSWLVKSLLQRGYTVNATLRNPKDEAKTGPLVSLPGAAERLKLFQADLSEEGAFDSAVEGCEGVFDVASPMDFTKLSEDDYVQPSLKGVLNLLKSCSRAKSVRRVVYTSSVGAACPLNEEGELFSGSTLDESTWTPVDFMRRKQHPANVCIYSVSRLIEFLSQMWHNINVMMGAWASLNLARRLLIDDLLLLGDSKVIVDWLKGQVDLKVAALEHWKDSTKETANCFRDLSVSHIYREDNNVADSLSKLALHMPPGLLSFTNWVDGHAGPTIKIRL